MLINNGTFRMCAPNAPTHPVAGRSRSRPNAHNRIHSPIIQRIKRQIYIRIYYSSERSSEILSAIVLILKLMCPSFGYDLIYWLMNNNKRTLLLLLALLFPPENRFVQCSAGHCSGMLFSFHKLVLFSAVRTEPKRLLNLVCVNACARTFL